MNYFNFNFIASIDKFIYLLILTIPIFLITGGFLPDLILSISSLTFLLICLKKNKWDFFLNKFFFFFFLFYFYLLLNSLFSIVPFTNSPALFYFRFGVFAIMLSYILSKYKNFLNSFSIVSFITLFIVSFDGLFQFTFHKNLIGIEQINYARVSGFFGSKLIMGSYLSRMLPFAIIGLLYILELKKNIYILFLIFFFVTVLLISIIISGERASLIILLTNILFIFIFLKNKIAKKIILLSIINVLFLALLFLSIKNSPIFEEKKNNLVGRYSELNIKKSLPINGGFIYSEQHEQHFITGYKIFKEYPIFGAGPKAFRYLCDNYKFQSGPISCATHPHNILIQFLSELGIIGLLFLFYMLYFFFLLLVKHFYLFYFKNKTLLEDKNLLLILCILNSLNFIITTGNFFNQWLSIIMFLPVGFFIYEYRYK